MSVASSSISGGADAVFFDEAIANGYRFLTLVVTDGGNGYGGDNLVIGSPQLAFETAFVPEPSTATLLGLGSLGFIARRRRARRLA